MRLTPLKIIMTLLIALQSPLIWAQSVTTHSTAPETIFINAQIYAEVPAQALTISQGIISYLGDNQSALAFRDHETDIIDLEGASILPGFIDNHNHVFEAASDIGSACLLSHEETLAQLILTLKQCSTEVAPQQWVIGYGFSLDLIVEGYNNRTPLQILDAIFPDQPVIFMEQTSHSMWVNSQALKRAGIAKNTAPPQGGLYLKNPDSRALNGILLDNAGDVVMALAWSDLDNPFEQSYQGLQNGLAEAAAHGITTIGDGRLYWKRGWYPVWKEAQKRGELSARVALRPWIYPEEEIAPQLEFLKSIHTPHSDKRLIVNQVKMYSDGILINATAKTLQPYLANYLDPYLFPTTTGQDDNTDTGLHYIPPQKMKYWLNALNSINYGAHIHAIGDAAVHESLNAIADIRRQGGRLDYTLTHVEMAQDADIQRFKPLRVTADFQVGSEYIVEGDHHWAYPFIGKQRSDALMPINNLYRSGANISLSSDWNVHDINPLVGIANSLRMQGGLPDIDSAIDAYTINAAKSLGLDKITGSITLGKSADLVILEQDITQLSPNRIAQTEILMTLLQGEIVFDSDPAYEAP